MSITSGSNSTRKWPNFKAETRRSLVIELMATGRTIRSEFESRPDYYRDLGIESVDDLASAIIPIGNRFWKYLTKYHNEVQPARSKASAALRNQELDDDRRSRLTKLIDMADKYQLEVEREGLTLDESITYRRLSRGQGRSNAASINQFVSGFDDVLAENEFLLSELEVEESAD